MGQALAHGNCPLKASGDWVKTVFHNTADSRHRNTPFTRHLDDLSRAFAHERLAVEFTLAGDDHVGNVERTGKSVVSEHIRSARQEFTVEQVHHQGGNASCGTTARPTGNISPHKVSDMQQATLQLFHLLGRSAFLRRINPC